MQQPPSDLGRSPTAERWRTTLDVVLLSLLVLVTYFARIGELPPLGEEGRRARGAIDMIETGDWIVTRQGGVVLADRPPLTNWLIALAGEARGGVDIVAARLPSTIAVLLTTLLVYFYCIRVDTRSVAVTAATVYATAGQVLQIGRLAESEAVFALFLAGSLLLWHLAFISGWRPVSAWLLGYSLAAVAALSKGLQAPVYFVGTTVVFLLLRRRWRWLFGWGQWIGLAAFVLIVAAWQVPYLLATDLQTSIDIWFAMIGLRLEPGGLLGHVVSYPLEVIGSLAPWSLVLLALAEPRTRRDLVRGHPQLAFILTSLAVTFPTVWLSAGAHARYYMPLYPCAAVLIGVLIARTWAAPASSFSGRLWRAALLSAQGVAVATLVALMLAEILPADSAFALRQSVLWSGLLILAAGATLAGAARARRRPGATRATEAVLAAAVLLGVVYATFRIDYLVSRREDPRPVVAELRGKIPAPGKLVSLGPVDARFAFAYRDFIPEVAWPTTVAEVPPDLDYFCFDVRATDTAETRYAERGAHDSWTTPGTLPFAWEEIGRVPITPRAKGLRNVTVVIGRARREEGR